MEVIRLDKEKLSKSFDLLAIRVPNKLCGPFIKNLKGHCWKKTKNVIRDPNEDTKKLILLSESVVHDDLRDLTDDCRKFVNEHKEVEVVHQVVKVGYEHMTADEVFKQILPSEIELVTSFEKVGHIAHMNLKPDSYPYKHIIGQVILEKNKHIKTVVNKIGEIDNLFRTFKMELLAGIDDMNTEVKESGCRFQFNFAEVYWNSRLCTEHDRLVKIFKTGQVVADVFSGVGPFAIPAAKSGCIVHANDLNPRSYHYLQENAKLNNCTSKVTSYNMDGREFIKLLVRGGEGRPPLRVDHVVMNLPATAVSFLDVFRGLYLPEDGEDRPFIHCYGFSKAEDVPKDLVEQVETVLKVKIVDPTIMNIRLVAPKKWMVRISFRLPLLVRVEETTSNTPPTQHRTGLKGAALDDLDDLPELKKRRLNG